MREREAFQELDYRAVFGTIAKWAIEIDDPARIPELVSRAFHTACNGRPGPVVIALPEDMLIERAVVPDAAAFEPVEIWPGLTDMSRLQKLLWAAKRPIALVGGSRWSEAACAALTRFAERFALPVATTFRRGHLFDALHPCYAGDLGIGPNPKLLARVKGADLVLLIGDRMSEMPSQSYTLFDIPEPQMKLVHVHPGAEELGRVYHPHLAINASPTAFCSALEGLQPPNEIAWAGEAKIAHADFMSFGETATPVPGRGQSRRDHDLAAREPARRRDPHQRRRQFRRLDSSLLPPTQIRQPGRGDLRLHGLRLSGRARHEDAASGAHRGVHRRRRRLPDDGAGFHHRRAIRVAGDRRDLRQRASTAPSACTRSANIPAA